MYKIAWFTFIAFSCFAQKPLMEGIKGKQAYKTYPYITAGNRLYAIGAQNGTFPEIGWHVSGEMGGVWDHPIKLLDGYRAAILSGEKVLPLNDAQGTNYPFSNTFVYRLADPQLRVEQMQFVPDDMEGMVVEYRIKNTSSKAFWGKFSFSADVDLRPTWLGERSNMIDAEDQIKYRGQLLFAKDRLQDWYCVIGASEHAIAQRTGKSSFQGKGLSGELMYALQLQPNQTKTIRIFIAGSSESAMQAEATIKSMKSSSTALFQAKKKRFEAIESQSKLTTSDPTFDKTIRWLKYNSDGFIREVPAWGRGIAAGYPDYPWWFGCDSEYALQGYLAIGSHDLVKDNVALLARLSAKTNTNGRIVHETSTNGEVYNPGNINETPQFISLLWNAYRWTGDVKLLKTHVDLIKRGMDWILHEKDANQNGFPEGSGMMEIQGLESEMIDVASYTQRGLADAAKIVRVLGEEQLANDYAGKAAQLAKQINDRFWSADDRSFGDFIADDAHAIDLLDKAIVRADTLRKPWSVDELMQTKKHITQNPSKQDRPFVLHHNWVVNTPMEMGIADPAKAQQALETARKFVNPFGVFVTGIDRDETAGKELGSFKGSKLFSYTGAVMTLPTGVSAVAENQYGHPDEALDYLHRMGRSFSYASPGSIYEVSPDYGMFTQAWNLYGYAVPVVQQFFGIQPMAANKQIIIQPLMPAAWSFARLDKVKIGQNQVSIHYTKTMAGYTLAVQSAEMGWDIQVLARAGYVLAKKQKTPKGFYMYRYLKNSFLPY